MNLSLRTLLVAGLLQMMTMAVQAQAVAPAPPSVTPMTGTEVKVASTALLPPAQVNGNYKDYLKQRYANDRYAQAAIHMFAQRQTGGALWLASGVAAITFVVSKTGTTTDKSGTTTVTVSPIGYGLLLGLFGGVGIGKLARFGNEKLYKAMGYYDQNSSFPSFVASRIKAGDR